MYSILIRPLLKEDAKTSFQWRNDPEVWKFTGNKPDITITYEIELAWIQDVLKKSNEIRFAICVQDSGKYIGNVQLTNINGYDAQLHLFIGDKENWGKGYGTEATRLMVEYGVKELGLQSIYLDVKKVHIAAIRTYQKAGFYNVFTYDDFQRMSIYNADTIRKKVSIFSMTFNHEKFIREALEGFLKQRTDFDFEIVLGDDVSTDNTRKIVLEYALKNPGKFKLLFYPKNISAAVNQVWILKNCSGKYIALCEGDDYWTDPYKLQKQVDYLEANGDYAICFTGYKIKNEFQNEETMIDSLYGSFTIEDVINENSFSTATALFVSKYFDPQIDWFPKMSFGDWTLYMVILFQSKKKAHCLKDVTSVYRIHEGGIHGNLHASNMELVKAYKMHIDFYRAIKKYLFKDEYSDLISKGIKKRKGIIAGLLKKENKHLDAIFSKWY